MKKFLDEKIVVLQNSIQNWIYCSIVFCSKYLVIPAILLIIYVSTILFLSIIIFLWFRSAVMPKNVLRESIQFNYLSHTPTANLSFFQAHKQWENFLLQRTTKQTKINQKRFMKSGVSYNIDAELILAKSKRNYENNKISIILSLFDATGFL